MKAFTLLIFLAVLLVGYGKSWDQQYEEWIKDPVPYGGLSILQKIKEAKDSGVTELSLSQNNSSDLTPLAGLKNLTKLNLEDNNISDLTPLAGLTNLTELGLHWNNISDLTPLAGLTNLTGLDLRYNNISISDSQKALLKASLPNTDINW